MIKNPLLNAVYTGLGWSSFWFGYLWIQPMSVTWSLSYLINVDIIHLNKNALLSLNITKFIVFFFFPSPTCDRPSVVLLVLIQKSKSIEKIFGFLCIQNSHKITNA